MIHESITFGYTSIDEYFAFAVESVILYGFGVDFVFAMIMKDYEVAAHQSIEEHPCRISQHALAHRTGYL